MKGNNQMLLNTATMMEAVQMWLNAQFTKVAPTVTMVRMQTNGSEHTFVVNLSSEERK